MTIGKILQRNALQYPEKTALAFQDKKISFSELNDIVNRLANGLLNLGLEKGDRVAILMPKIPEVIFTFLAVARAGGVIFPVNYKLKSEDLRTIFNYVSPQMVISERIYSPLLEKLFLPYHPLSKVIFTGKRAKKELNFKDIIDKEVSTEPNVKVKENDFVYLNYTSGTTGVPKGVLTSHANIVYNTIAAIDAFNFTHQDIHLCMFPSYMHPHELFARGLYLGGTTVLSDSIFPKTIAREIQDNKVTAMMAVPYFYKSLFPLAKNKEYDFSSLRIPEAGGMYSPPEFIDKFEQLLRKKLLPVWGSTETTGIAAATRPDEGYKSGSVGRACMNYDIKVVDFHGDEVPDGADGEMIIKGPAVMHGYFNLPGETENVLKNEWYFTGDIVRKDEKGHIYFLGRKSGMMKVGGMKVYPLEIVEAITSHPEVDEVAVVSERDMMRGERPKAFVVLNPGSSLSEGELRGFIRTKLADYKIPRKIEFIKELPKTSGGKIIKGALERKDQSPRSDATLEEIEELAEIDRKLVELLNERAEAVMKLHEKLEPQKHSIFFPDYEESLIRQALDENKGPIYDESLEEIFDKIRAVIRLI